jgi:hypothetical protein
MIDEGENGGAFDGIDAAWEVDRATGGEGGFQEHGKVEDVAEGLENKDRLRRTRTGEGQARYLQGKVSVH